MPIAKKAPKTTNLQAGAGGGGWQQCLLTWYDPALGGVNSSHGQADPHAATASGEPYDATKNTCAAPPNYAFGTMLTFRYGNNSVTCRVNDRGGAITGSHFDLSRAAGNALGIINAGAVTGAFKIGGSAGSAAGAASNAGSGNGGSSGGFGGIGSLWDLVTAPLETIGGALAGVTFVIMKDTVEAVGDYIIRPAWHWNQRAVKQYETDMFGDKSGKILIATAAFWGGGYWLLFTDPNKKSLAPAPVRNSRLAKHVRFGQSIPARKSLVKPKNVAKKTPLKPKPVTSRAVVTQTGTMRTTRHQRVTVTGTHVTRSSVPVESETAPATRRANRPATAPTKPDAKPGTRTRSPTDRGRTTPHTPTPRSGGRR